MNPERPEPDDGPAAPHGRGPGRARILLGFCLGLALLAAAAWTLRGQSGALAHAWRSLRDADPVVWALLLGLPVLNCVLSAESLLLLTRRFCLPGAALPRREMLALVGAAWLLNFLPLKPGLLGRVAYHRQYHGIRVRDSARALLETIACGAAALLLLGAALALGPSAGPTPLLGLLLLGPCLYLATRFSGGREGSPTVRAFLAVLSLKLMDTFVWAVRYQLVFQLAGRPADLSEGIALAIVGQVATLVPLAGNGLGLREWAIGLLAASLPAWASAGDGAPAGGLAVGLSADLVNRAAETVAALPVGLLALAWLARRRAAESQATP